MGTVTDLPAQGEETEDERLARLQEEQRERLTGDGPLAATGEEPAEPWQGDEAEEEPSEELVLEGSQAQLSFDVGGKAPTSSHLTLTGGQIDVAAGYEKGDEFELRVRVRVQEVAFRDELDAKTGQVVGAKRKHKARIVSIRALED